MSDAVRNISEKINLQAALWYAEHGYYVFPLFEISRGVCSCSSGSRCGAPGKHPRTAKGFKEATTDPEVIQKWFRKWPGAGVGIATGLSGLVVLDVDPRNHGRETLARLQQEHGDLPRTPRVYTGGGGDHFYFKKPGDEFDGFVLGQGIDVKSDGGYVVAPPTMHIQGVAYTADPDAHIASTIPAELPQWIIERKKEAKKKRRSSGKVSEGFMGAAMEAAGWLGKAMGVDRTAIKCPWESQHTSGRALDGSTVVFAPLDGSRTGWAHCSHSHCAHRTQEEWIAALPEEACVAARERLHMDPNYTPSSSTPEPQKPTGKVDAWKQNLCWDQYGNMSKEAGNLELVLSNDPVWKDCLGYDEFKGLKVWLEQPPILEGMMTPQLGQVLEQDNVYLQQYFKKNNNVSFPMEAIRAAIETACKANTYHPVQDYLNGLEWDRIPRVDRWLATYLGAPDDEYTQLISPWWLVSAVARIFQPGCKADSVLILEGSQGVGKSTAMRILGDPWFCDTPIDIGNKDAYLTMRGRWIIELAELESLDRAEASRAKAFFTSPTDTYRAPYGRDVLEVPRQCVFVGTVNHGEYLRDETGGRRYLPIKCGKIDLRLLDIHRDQLWAEAVCMYHAGEVWWPTTQEQIKLCGGEQAARYVADEWESVVREFVTGKTEVTIRDILQTHFGFLSKEWTRGHEMRVASCLKRLGFLKKRKSGGAVWSST